MITTTAEAGSCPQCGTATVSVREAMPWCADCEWNLDGYDRARQAPEFGWSWVDRRTHRLAARLTQQQYAALVERPLAATGLGVAGTVTVVASLLLVAAVLAMAVLGVWLMFAYPFPSLAVVVGLALVGLAVALRPRFGRVDPELEVLSREQAPGLHALVEEVAAAIGAPVPHVVGVDGSINAYATSVGLRRRRVLCLGLPLWGSLDGQARVALLGHELGHFVNGDVRRLLVTDPALTMLGSAADLFRPAQASQGGGLLEMIGEAIGRMLSWLLSRLLFAGHLLLVVTALRDSQRAEYLADEMSARAAGTAGATRLLDVLLSGESVALVVRQGSRGGHGPATWRAGVARSLAGAAERLPLLRQLSVREQVSLFASHPPAGLRHRMLTARAWQDPAVVLTETRAEEIDAELDRHYRRVSRAVAWSG
ncbi:M48 family metalloprotease [Micromonospora purpureochromogenes]|uniref:Zn-dependent protease with chaperone function n=1 Tax=Micromonospora purpureochromogenes TaxID=47872 RepID=A0ABX2RDK8_9ACTN|nr:M48 family metallopeptidase [Micromonospora purpureochromogenes]NYF54436.1 Zn-dependent protease with chaperone function [Micromonospora purpureochromogenes]